MKNLDEAKTCKNTRFNNKSIQNNAIQVANPCVFMCFGDKPMISEEAWAQLQTLACERTFLAGSRWRREGADAGGANGQSQGCFGIVCLIEEPGLKACALQELLQLCRKGI